MVSHARNLFEQITNTDGKTLRTLWALLARPGDLTVDHLAGRRARYLQPFQLFLLVNVLLFISAPQVPLFSYSLEKYLRYAPPSPELVERLVRNATPYGHTHDAARGGKEFDQFREHFDSRVEAQRKSLIILFAPAIALVLLGTMRLRRERIEGPIHYGQHLIFSLHLLAFVWLLLAIVGVVARMASGVLTGPGLGETLLIASVSVISGWGIAYLMRAIRRVYVLSWPKTVAAASLVMGAFVAALVAYRALLFFTTYYTL